MLRRRDHVPPAAEVAAALYDCYMDAASGAFHTARYEDARECLEKACEEADAFDARDARHAYTLNALGIALFHTRRYADAERTFGRALAAYARAGSTHTPRYAVCLANRAAACVRLGNLNEAEWLYTRALDVAQQALGADDPQLAWDLEALGVLQAQRGADVQAGFSLHRALRLQRAGGGVWDLSVTLRRCADWMMRRDHNSQAEALLSEAVLIRSKLLGDDDPSLAPFYSCLGRLHTTLSNYANAEWMLRRALSLRGAAEEWDTRAMLEDIAALSVVYRRLVRAGDLHRLEVIAAALRREQSIASKRRRDEIRKHEIGAMLNWLSPSPRWV